MDGSDSNGSIWPLNPREFTLRASSLSTWQHASAIQSNLLLREQIRWSNQECETCLDFGNRFRVMFRKKHNCLKSSPRVYCKIGYFFCQTAKRCTSSLSRGAFRVSSSLSHDRKKRARKGRVVVAKVHHEWYHLHHHHLDLAAFHKLFFLVVHSQFRGQSRYYNYVR